VSLTAAPPASHALACRAANSPRVCLRVEMFFVLFGYLITAIIHREARAQGFSLRRLSEGRVRRIMPALLAVLAVTTVAAVMLLPSGLIGSPGACSRRWCSAPTVHFWRDTDCFAAGAARRLDGPVDRNPRHVFAADAGVLTQIPRIDS
jgi:peptidoglycan/LPS O-acetylase OafA/YrhL